MATKQLKDGFALLCDDCGVQIFADYNMVMLNDELWTEISDRHEDEYCDCCIEKRMGRPIEIEDFKEMGVHMTIIDLIPCNAFWLYHKRPDKFVELRDKINENI